MTRSATDIGAGLAPTRPARPIVPGERIHVVGIAGAGASAAALLAAAAGARVSGCDPGAPSPYTAALEAQDIPIATAHDAGHVAGPAGPLVDRLAVSKALTAIAPDHPELAAARAHGVPLEPWQQVVADAAASAGQSLVAVAGTHGKSTSTGWLLHVLTVAGHDPSGFAGALLPSPPPGSPASTARVGRGSVCVVEADEYAGNFDPYRPAVAILLDAEWDHPDVFVDEAAVLDAFETWLRAAAEDWSSAKTTGQHVAGQGPVLVVNADDRGAATVAGRLADWPGRIVRVGLDLPAGGVATDDEAASASVELTGHVTPLPDGATELELAGPLLASQGALRARLALDGRHNAANAVCVAAAAAVLGTPAAAIAQGLASFPGVGRRLERKGEPRGVLVLDDYGHHPSAIRATLATVRGRYPGRPVWAVYEPLTYHRTAAMLDAFADVLATADHAVIADIWAGRDPDRTVASAEGLAAAITARGGPPALATGSPEATADRLAGLVAPGDVVLVMGGGRSYVIAERLVDRLGGAR